jgi:hypothetical protein
MKSTLLTFAALAVSPVVFAQVTTTESAYLAGTAGTDFTFSPIVTTGDLVPLTNGGASDTFAFAGIPDAMGLYKDAVSGQNILFCAHELGGTLLSQPLPGSRFKGSFVSRFVLSNDGSGVISAAPAYSRVFVHDTLFSNAPIKETDAGNGFGRFCSGSFAGVAEGLDRPFFFAAEESAPCFNAAKGPQTAAIYDGDLHVLSSLGAVARETTRIQPRRDSLTVAISTEDGSNPSFIYMYVGTKQRRAVSALDKNGFTGGKIYVLAGRDAQHNEGTFTTGSLPVKWVEIPGGAALTSSQLREAADDAGGFGFVRVEDAEFDPTQPTRSIFLATTGGSGPNQLGRLYELTMTPTNPTGAAALNVVYNADLVATPGGTYNGVTGQLIGTGATGSLGTYSGGNVANGVDFPVSIDNLAVSKDFIVVCEDTNSPANAVYNQYSRHAGVWTLNRNNNYAAKLQATFNYAYCEARDAHAPFNEHGLWESSGVIDSSSLFGPGTFLINVQAHLRTVALNAGGAGTSMRSNCPDGSGGFLTPATAASRYAEDGQIMIMRPIP